MSAVRGQRGTRNDAKGLYFCVGSRDTNVCGYAWRLWWGQTSFYVKARASVFEELKISLHGPDPLRGGRPGFKLGRDTSTLGKENTERAVMVTTADYLPQWFSGRPVHRQVTHVVRFRTTWDMFGPGVPTAPNPGEVKAGFTAGLISPPPPGSAADVDIYVSDGKPYWPNETQARRENACLGPIRNRAHQSLSGVVVRRSVLTSPTPQYLLPLSPTDVTDRIRGLAATVDDTGLLWIAEKWMSRSEMQSQASADN